MERKIGETFEYEGEKLKVIKAGTACDGCYFKGKSCENRNYDITGICGWTRKDNQPVRFIKVTEEQQDEQPQQKTKEPKERKIGEVFEFEGKKLQVRESHRYSCDGCFFNGHCEHSSNPIIGLCEKDQREDEKDVIFVEVQEQEEAEEQHQEEQPKLNLCEILRNCPKGEMFWSPVFDNVWFYDIDQYTKRVKVRTSGVGSWYINADGTITIDEVTSPEIMLYPSREQRDWTKVKYEPKKELPRTWEEFCKNYPLKKGECYMNSSCGLCGVREGAERQVASDRNLLPSREAAEAHLAYMQLHQLRDAWREEWLPEWTDDNQNKYVILSFEGEYEIFQRNLTSHFLSFQDEKRADEFMDCFIDLIRKAGDLI